MLDDQVEQRGEVLARAFQAVVGPAAAARGEHAGEVELVFAGVQRGKQVEDLRMDFDRAGVLAVDLVDDDDRPHAEAERLSTHDRGLWTRTLDRLHPTNTPPTQQQTNTEAH